MGTRANDLASLFTTGTQIDSSSIGTGAITDTKYGGTLSVDGSGNVTAAGTVSDSDGNVRTPHYVLIDDSDGDGSGTKTISRGGVYAIYFGYTGTLTLAGGVAGEIICIYNNKTTSATLIRGSGVTQMRLGADNNTTNNDSCTLGSYSLTTVTMVANLPNSRAIVTGTSVTSS